MLQPRSVGPPPWSQENSVPERSAPCKITGVPAPSTSWLPETWIWRVAADARWKPATIDTGAATAATTAKPRRRFQTLRRIDPLGVAMECLLVWGSVRCALSPLASRRGGTLPRGGADG